MVIYTKNTRKGEPIMDFKTNDILDVSINVNEENNKINYGATYSLNGEILLWQMPQCQKTQDIWILKNG